MKKTKLQIHGLIIAGITLLILASFFTQTFAKTVNTGLTRKVFAEKLVKTLQIQPIEKEKCYKDVKKTDKYSPYICALQKAKIFSGSKKSNFNPNKKTTWKFVIESFCKAQKWTEKKTFSQCLAYLKEKKSPQKFVTKEELSTFIKKLTAQTKTKQVTAKQDIETIKSETDKIPPLKTGDLTFIPFAKQNIPVDFFDHVKLSDPLPNTFYKDEVYFIEGNFTDLTADEAFVFLCKDGQGCGDAAEFIEETTNSGVHFKIPLHFKEIGNLQIGIIPGRSGQSKIENISVMPVAPQSEGGQKPTQLAVKYANGKTNFSWNGSGSMTRLTFFQGEKRIDYIFRQNTKIFTPNSIDFASFKKGSVSWLVQQDSAQSEKETIDVTIQDFSKTETDEIEIKTLQEVFKNPGHFIFSAKSLSAISPKAAIIRPNGQVEEIIFSQSDITSGEEFTIETNLAETGTYIFEVNSPEGSAVVNTPIYVGNSVPLLPDYFALHPPKLNKSPLTDLNEVRQQFLKLINSDRDAHNLKPVALSNELNVIAQAHSQNMVDFNFFGHINPQGLGPDDRRKNAKYPAPIKENLGKATGIEDMERGLMRSPIHRMVIIDSLMTHVGIGLVKNNEGYFIGTQNFSADPIQQSNLTAFENDLFNFSASKRQENSLQALNNNTDLHEAALEWSNKMTAEAFFGTTDSHGSSVIDITRKKGISSSLQVYLVKAGEKSQLEEELIKQNGLQNAANKNIGIGLSINEIGELFMTVIYMP